MSDLQSVERDELDVDVLKAGTANRGALNIFVVGLGQCGNNLADAFHQLGYPAAAVNTNTQDMARLKLPKERQLVIGDDGEGGAARNLDKGKAIAERYREEIRAHLTKCMGGEKYDYALLCASAGGGTGAGGCFTFISVLQDLLANTRRNGEPNVGTIIALPASGEDPNVNANAYRTLTGALDMVDAGQLSPLILLDNARMQKLKGVNLLNFRDVINMKIAQHIVRFNHAAAKDAVSEQFDKADWRRIFTSGIVTFGVTPVRRETDAEGEPKYCLVDAVKQELTSTVFLDVPNYRNSDTAGIIIVGPTEKLGEVGVTDAEDGFKEFGKLLADNHRIFRGVYEAEDEKAVTITTVIGNLGRPEGYLKKLKDAGLVAR